MRLTRLPRGLRGDRHRIFDNLPSFARRSLLRQVEEGCPQSQRHRLRVLKEIKESATGPRRRKGATAIRRSVPVRTFSDWDDPAPGFVEADLVSHSGPYARGVPSRKRWC